MSLERIQFIGVLVWMIGMLAMVIYAMREMIRSENAAHQERQEADRAATKPTAETKPSESDPS